MPAGADRERQPGLAAGADRGGHVVGVGGVRDGGGAAVDRAVPAGAGVVVVGVAGLDEAADEAAGLKLAARGEVGVVVVFMTATIPPAGPPGIGGLPYLYPPFFA